MDLNEPLKDAFRHSQMSTVCSSSRVGLERSYRALWRKSLPLIAERDEARARIDGPDVLLVPNTAQAIAVTLHELATNAAKYGSLSVAKGQVEVTWSWADGQLTLRWTESGGPAAKKPTRKGFGTRVVERMIREQLKGEMHLDWRAEGLACEIFLKM